MKIEDDFQGYDLNEFFVPDRYRTSLSSVLITHGMVVDRAAALAREVNDHFGDQELVILGVLNGCFRFYSIFAEALNQLRKDFKSSLFYDFIRLKSYVNSRSLGEVQVQGGNLLFLAGKNVLVVEDIIETGGTMQKLAAILNAVRPLSVKVLTLLTKRTDVPSKFEADFVGFDIPNCFVVGFGFDYNEMFRDMDHICVINDYGKTKYAQNCTA